MDLLENDFSPALTVILPACNEETLIGACLRSVLESHWTSPDPLETIVIANGCTDETAGAARKLSKEFADKNWRLTVLTRESGGKLGALNAGDHLAASGNRVYLDADVQVSPGLLDQLRTALDSPKPLYASGVVTIPRPSSWISRAYARVYRQVPFMTHGVPGCGLFAVNAAGRARWGDYPSIISDDTFVRLNFAPSERISIAANYHWPIVEGFANLVRVRRRQNIGVDEVARRYPQLMQNDDKPAFPLGRKLRMALMDPVGFAIYSSVSLIARATESQNLDWRRGR